MLHRLSSRGLIVYVHDIVMAALSFVLSLYLRLGDVVFYYDPGEWLLPCALFTAICAAVFWMSDLYRGVWRYASIRDLWAITKAVSTAILIFAFVMFLWTRLEDLARSIPIINWFVLMALLGGPRFFYRLAKDRRFDLSDGDEINRQVPVLLVGAGDGAELFLRALRGSEAPSYRAVGIVSENSRRVGREIHGVPVVGTTDDLASIVDGLKRAGDPPRRLVVTKDDMDGARMGKLLEQADALGMTLARLPQLTDFQAAGADAVEVRPVAVEDILGRPQTPLDRESMQRMIENQRVLITGAGGSIGSELVRQVVGFAPAELTLLDHSEFSLYSIDQEAGELDRALPRRAVIADVRDRENIAAIFARVRPQLVFHAAALKHVPLVEENPQAGVLTNVTGTVNVADACVENGAATMVLISTDKAVNPTSIMGAAKRIAESYCQALDLSVEANSGTRFVTVRFGNVLGSTGSVVPLFEKQLRAGGPLTVTHPDMTRYFMTVREAVELVLQASALASLPAAPGDAATGKIFVLDMGEPVRILDLARQMIRLAGKRPDEDVMIEIVGPRPGEKLFEEVLHGSESLVPASRPGLLLAAPRTNDLDVLTSEINKLAAACRGELSDGDLTRIMELLAALVPEYQPPAKPETQAASA